MPTTEDNGRGYTALAATFGYLDMLRESGVTNMYGAGTYVMRDLGLDRDTASKQVALWMKTFSDESPEVRARAAIAKATATP